MSDTTRRRSETALRRQLVCKSLGIRPKDLRKAFGLGAVNVSFILRGSRWLSPKEQARMEKLVAAKLGELFSGGRT